MMPVFVLANANPSLKVTVVFLLRSRGGLIERTPHYVGLGALAALLTGFGLIADEVVEGDTLAFDTTILMVLRAPDDPVSPIGPAWVAEAARDITALGSFSILTLTVFGIVIFLVLVRQRRTATFLAISVAGGTIVSTILKTLFDRPRPDIAGAVRVFTSSFLAGVLANEGLQPLLGSLDDEVTGFGQQVVVRPRPPQSSECAPIARCDCESVGGPVGRLIRPGSCLAGVSVRPDLDERLA